MERSISLYPTGVGGSDSVPTGQGEGVVTPARSCKASSNSNVIDIVKGHLLRIVGDRYGEVCHDRN
jgi:hypothetical protein